MNPMSLLRYVASIPHGKDETCYFLLVLYEGRETRLKDVPGHEEDDTPYCTRSSLLLSIYFDSVLNL